MSPGSSNSFQELYEFLDGETSGESPRKKQRVSASKSKPVFDPQMGIDELFERDLILSKTEIFVVSISAQIFRCI